MSTPKPALRQALRAARRSLSPVEHRDRSRRASAALERLPEFRAGRRVAVYLPFDGEVDTAALLAAGRRRGVLLHVPVIGDRRHRRLKFCPLEGRMRRGTFGIAVPRRAVGALSARWFHLIVVPVVGIDADGRRLGMGLGFYDRATAFRRVRTHWSGPRLAGLAFDFQCVESVGAEPWDLRFDVAATESGLRSYPRMPPAPASTAPASTAPASTKESS
jgi:5-formyltetrahydrofolate cyclo-ligase